MSKQFPFDPEQEIRSASGEIARGNFAAGGQIAQRVLTEFPQEPKARMCLE
jgi:hypothetical protein